MATFLVMLDEAGEMGGCLYFLPGSHKLGVQPAVADETTTSYRQWTVDKERMREILRMLIEIARVPVEVRDDPERMRPSDVPLLYGDTRKLRAHTGWSP